MMVLIDILELGVDKVDRCVFCEKKKNQRTYLMPMYFIKFRLCNLEMSGTGEEANRGLCRNAINRYKHYSRQKAYLTSCAGRRSTAIWCKR